MKNLAYFIGILTISAALPFAGASAQIPASLICSTAEILECLPAASCERVAAESIGAPNFLRVNLADGEIARTPVGGEEIISPIERAEELDGRLVLQGAEENVERAGGGVGWTMSIDTHSGNMVLTASGHGVAFVIFGACIAP